MGRDVELMGKKLTEEDVKLIKKMRKQEPKISIKRIAEFFGVSTNTIHYHLHNKRSKSKLRMRKWRKNIKETDKKRYEEILAKERKWRKIHKEKYKVMVAKSMLKGAGITLCDDCLNAINDFIKKEK